MLILCHTFAQRYTIVSTRKNTLGVLEKSMYRGIQFYSFILFFLRHENIETKKGVEMNSIKYKNCIGFLICSKIIHQDSLFLYSYYYTIWVNDKLLLVNVQ